MVQVDDLWLHHLLAAKRKQLFDEAGRAGRRFADLREIVPQGPVAGGGLRGDLSESQDDGQEIVEVVGHAAREGAQRFQLL